MCVDCVKEEFPCRDTMCLEDGSYLLNFSRCARCQELGNLSIEDKYCSEDESGLELITYQHVCPNCGHIIASHEYSFTVEDGYMLYTMSCALCGEAEDQRSVLPYDDRQRSFF
ncbi:protein Churchill [Octopus sinensis]|uniref:Protein Churchill n=1 Tax=Octopus sinensis TaxID=2607531 RepID=A0A6P7SMN7_9MOLL|nr:protein Churchill [Octopus sinensis]